jgi:HEAT repeat protein
LAKKGIFEKILGKFGIKEQLFDTDEDCLTALKDPQAEIRVKALEFLGLRNTIPTIEPFVEIIENDEELKVKEAAIDALGVMKRAEAFPVLTGSLEHSDPWVRAKSAIALSELGDRRAVEPLRKAFEITDGEAKIPISQALMRFGDKEAIHELKQKQFELRKKKTESEEDVFLDDLSGEASVTFSEEDLRIEELYTAASQKKDKIALDTLAEYIRDPDEMKRLKTLKVLTRMQKERFIRDIIAEALNDSSLPIARMAADILKSYRNHDLIGAFIKLLRWNDLELRKHITHYLIKNSSDEITVYVSKALQVKNISLRSALLPVAAELDFQKIKASFLYALQDPDLADETVLEVLKKLPAMYDPDLLKYLLNVLWTGKDELVMQIADYLKELNSNDVRQFLISALSHETPAVRMRAARVLARMGEKEVSSTLLGYLDDPAPAVRIQAGQALTDLSERGAFDKMAHILNTEQNPEVRRFMLVYLSKLNFEKAFQCLSKSLIDPAPAVRCQALWEIKSFVGELPEELQEKVLAMIKDPEPEVVHQAVDTMVALHIISYDDEVREKAISLCRSVMVDSSSHVSYRKRALENLAALEGSDLAKYFSELPQVEGEEEIALLFLEKVSAYSTKEALNMLISSLQDKRESIAMRAAELLSTRSEKEIILPLLRMVAKNPHSPQSVPLLKGASKALQEYHEQKAAPLILRILTSDIPQIKEYAILCTGELGFHELKDFVAPLITDSNWRIRYEAAIALGLLKEKQAMQGLIDVIVARKQWEKRTVVLDEMTDEEKEKALSGKEEDQNAARIAEMESIYYDKLRRAIRAAGILEEPRLAHYLLEMCNNDRPQIARASKIALAKLRDETAVPMLMKFIDTRDPELLRMVLVCLLPFEKQVEINLSNALITENEENRIWAMKCLAYFHVNDVGNSLVESLRMRGWKARKWAARAIGKMLVLSAERELCESLNDHNDFYVKEALRTLGCFKSSSAVKYLETAFQRRNPGIREEAIRALGEFTSEHSVEYFRSALKDENPYVRYAAMRGIGRLEDSQYIEDLEELLASDNVGDRAWAAFSLVKSGDERGLDVLTSILNEPSHDAFREFLLYRDKRCEYFAFQPPSQATWDFCGPTLFIRDDYFQKIKDGDYEYLEEHELADEIVLFERIPPEVEGIAEALKVLIEIGDSDMDGLVKNHLNSQFEYICIHAIRALVMLLGESALPQLVPLLEKATTNPAFEIIRQIEDLEAAGREELLSEALHNLTLEKGKREMVENLLYRLELKKQFR